MMIREFIQKHTPAWVEVGILAATLFFGAAASVGTTYYKLDQVFEEVKDINAALRVVPVVVERVDQLERRTTAVEGNISTLEDRLYYLRTEITDAGKRSNESLGY